MIEELVSIAFRGMFRLLMWIFIELIIELAFYVIGYPIVKIATLGRYPRHGIFDGAKTDDSSEFYVSIVGLLVAVLFLVIVFSTSL